MAEWTNALDLGSRHLKGARRFESCFQHRVRFAPNPTYYAHLGHLRGLIALKYFTHNKGIHLRFDDTSEQPFCKAYSRSFLKLFRQHEIKLLSVSYASSRSNFRTYFKNVQRLLNAQKAYVCKCVKNIDCAYRSENCACASAYFKFTFNKSEVVRFKTFLKHDKDYVIYRYNNRLSRFMPTLVFQTAVDDIKLRITHLFRGKDLHSSEPRLREIYCALTTAAFPICKYWGRVSLYNSRTNQEYVLSKRAKTPNTELPSLNAIYKYVTPSKIECFFKDYGFTQNNIKMDLRRLIKNI